MGKIKLAVVGDSLYAERLAQCIQKNAPEYLNVLSCVVLNNLREFLMQMQPDILLCEQETEIEEKLLKYIVHIQLVDEKSGEESKGYHVFRYQRATDILRQVFQIYERSTKKNLVCCCKTANVEMTVFYSPGGHDLLLPVSVCYASLCGESEKVLYLSLSEFSGMKILFHDKDENNLSDFIFGIRQKKERFLLCLQSVLHHAEQFDYVLPPENPEDLYEIQEEDLANLLTMLQQQTEYKKIIWSCGTMNQAALQVMECCQKIIYITKDNMFSKFRKTEFEHFLQKEPMKMLQEKMQFLNLQIGKGTFVQGADLLTQLQTGEFADQIRNQLKDC